MLYNCAECDRRSKFTPPLVVVLFVIDNPKMEKISVVKYKKKADSKEQQTKTSDILVETRETQTHRDGMKALH
jgi:hypothetical protein